MMVIHYIMVQGKSRCASKLKYTFYTSDYQLGALELTGGIWQLLYSRSTMSASLLQRRSLSELERDDEIGDLVFSNLYSFYHV